MGIFALFTITSSAQLKVDSMGNVGIGTNNQMNTRLTVGATGKQGYGACIQSGDTGGLYLYNDTAVDRNTNCMLYANLASGASPRIWGIYSGVKSLDDKDVYGVTGLARDGLKNIGIFGGAYSPNNSINKCVVGVFGSSNTLISMSGINGTYAGYFKGDVRATGTIYGTLVSPSSVSSPAQGGATINLSEQATRGETITEKLQRVDLLQMERVNQDGSVAANKVLKKIDVNENEKGLTEEEHIQTRLPSVSYGLAADQLKEVYPELVYEDKEGNYSINYVEMVPLLVQSIKELSAEVATLKEQLGIQDPSKPVMKVKEQTTAIEETETDVVTMSQNKPNPFSDSSVITLNIPETTKSAVIGIYDMSGKQVQAINVPQRGQTDITVFAAGLTPGMYVYNLIVDGKVQVSRKMIVQHL